MKNKSNIDFDKLEPSDHFSNITVNGIRYKIGAKGRLPTLEEIDTVILKHLSNDSFKKCPPKTGTVISLDVIPI
jgi:hypothetical protein